MRIYTKLALVVLAIAVDVLVLYCRSSRPHLPVHIREHALRLGEAQAKVVVEWQRMQAVPTSTDSILQYVEALHWNDCVRQPDNAVTVAVPTLSADQKADLDIAIANLIQVYANGTPSDLLDYMSNRNLEMSQGALDQFKRLLQSDAGMSSDEIAVLNDRELTLTFARRMGFATHWKQLIPGAGASTLWKFKTPNASINDDAVPGKEAIELFKNQTRYQQLFADRADNASKPKPLNYSLYADICIVVKHDEKMQNEPSPYYIRFGFNPSIARWQPLEMVHVPTVSGKSPTLFF